MGIKPADAKGAAQFFIGLGAIGIGLTVAFGWIGFGIFAAAIGVLFIAAAIDA